MACRSRSPHGSLALVLLAALLQGCSGDDEGPRDLSGRAQAVIGPAGGTLQVSAPGSDLDGVALTVPPGAVTQDTTFSIEWGSDAIEVPAALSIDHPPLQLGPAASFAADLELSLPVTYLPTGEGHILGAYCWNPARTRWSIIPARRIADGRLIVPVKALGLCRWGTIRLGEVDAETARAWLDDLPLLVDGWQALRTRLLADLAPFVSLVENPAMATQCATQDEARAWLEAGRQRALASVSAYLASAPVVEACRICDRGGGCTPAVCDAEELISGQPVLWLAEEVRIWMRALFISSACPVDVLAPLVERMVAWAAYQQSIRNLGCDWRCVMENGTEAFYGDLLLGNVCTFSLLAVDLYQEHNPCP